MKEFLEKLAPYHFFNYLLPGTLFVFLTEILLNYDLYQEDIVLGLVLYYFIGLVISRIGSLILDPILKKLKILVFTEYDHFILASKNDPKIEALSEVNNMYRTLASLFLILLILKTYTFIVMFFKLTIVWNHYILFAFILILFIFAYRKQSEYITKRVKTSGKKNSKN